MSKKSELAAMKYLAEANPKRYKLRYGKCDGFYKHILYQIGYEYCRDAPPLKCWKRFHEIKYDFPTYQGCPEKESSNE